ncbi:GNAT family N-acetyltransferase [Vasconcelosia minhoensis]|uniref:GNAT family N-acetyltransferase n=1 Tax=Vasconcelosia minhoensis TaxID=3366354 RepID=UPI002AD58C16|nr:GNAT family N-acetyltransferase [Romeria gracilis]
MQHYPDDQTWWIGLMLLAPEQRGQGLGADFYRTFERWLVGQGGRSVSLCAIAANAPGRQFWQRMGFEVIRKTPPRPYGNKTHEVYVFRRTLPVAQSIQFRKEP